MRAFSIKRRMVRVNLDTGETYEGMFLGTWDGMLVLDVARLVVADGQTHPIDNRLYLPRERMLHIQTQH